MPVQLNNPIPTFESAEDYWRFVMLALIAYCIYRIMLEIEQMNRTLISLNRRAHKPVVVEIVDDEPEEADEAEEE